MLINIKGRLVDFSIPRIMGILNLTPDSFYDGGKHNSDLKYLTKTEQMLRDGADIIDVGAFSSRPGGEWISEDEELERLIFPLEQIIKNFPEAVISVDTFRSNVAKKSVENGAAMINDISAGGLDTEMMKTVSALQVPYIMMHMRGTPQTMNMLTDYKDVVKEVIFYFSEKIREARTAGINDLIIDPGFGFAKTVEQNYEILSKLELFRMLELPVLVGISRKSMIYKLLNINSEQSLNGTTVLNTIALQKGANILRVHDVKEAVECVKIQTQLL